ncbi:MAG: hypothetical protein CMP67_10250 [Flavobacteriales bacterium]|nr:hypothetical protein [Flavobacteriales bacterium]|tara:strand:- start:9233 stop:10738 length:1506 start_codon:yes stop_codon:yes gene_type:complete
MNIFKRISKIIERLNLFKQKKRSKSIVPENDIQSKILEIEKSQESERKSIISQKDKSVHERVQILSDSQEKLIDEKVKILETSNTDKNFQKLKELNRELEILKTNFLYQFQFNFELKIIEQKLIKSISKELVPKTLFDNSFRNKQNLKIAAIENREAEKEEINKLKNEVVNFLLVRIHNEREAARKLKERLERERKLDEEYLKYINASFQAIKTRDFTLAKSKLNQALTIKPENKKEIIDLLESLDSKQREFKNNILSYKSLFDLAEKSFHDREFEKAIEFYTKAKQLNVDNLICIRRISDAQNKILKLKKREKEKKEKEKLEKEHREKFKSDAKEIVAFYQANGISEFYHYTDSRNLDSIIQNNGLFSLREMSNRNIFYHKGSETSELENYIRLSYTQNHPLLHVSKKKGRIRKEKTFKISLNVAELKETKFTNVNATRTKTYPTVKMGDDLNFIENNVKINIVKARNYRYLPPNQKPYYQAEIMVKDYLPLEYIKNLNN